MFYKDLEGWEWFSIETAPSKAGKQILHILFLYNYGFIYSCFIIKEKLDVGFANLYHINYFIILQPFVANKTGNFFFRGKFL